MPPPIVIAHIPFQSSTLVIRQHLPTDATALSRLGSNPSVWKKLRNRMPHPYTPSDAAAWICQCNNPENWVSVKGPLGPCPTGNGGPSSLTRDEGFAIEGEGNPSLTSSTGEESSPSTNKDDKHPSPPTSRCQDGKDLFPQFFVIALDDTVIGSCSLQFGSDVYLRSAELGYWLGEKFWGRGIASRVAGAMVEWAWGTFGWLFRIEAVTVRENLKSARVLEKAGFRREGERCYAVWKGGRFWDEITWFVLRPRLEMTGEMVVFGGGGGGGDDNR